MLPSLKERFESGYTPEPMSGCWIWIKHRDKDGYGKTTVNNITTGAHRASYVLHKGEIPLGLYVLHACDNPSCVNPDHLYAGDQKQNKGDSVRQRRHVHGFNHHKSKLTPSDVASMMKMMREGVTYAVIGERFGLTACGVWAIAKGKARPDLGCLMRDANKPPAGLWRRTPSGWKSFKRKPYAQRLVDSRNGRLR